MSVVSNLSHIEARTRDIIKNELTAEKLSLAVHDILTEDPHPPLNKVVDQIAQNILSKISTIFRDDPVVQENQQHYHLIVPVERSYLSEIKLRTKYAILQLAEKDREGIVEEVEEDPPKFFIGLLVILGIFLFIFAASKKKEGNKASNSQTNGEPPKPNHNGKKNI